MTNFSPRAIRLNKAFEIVFDRWRLRMASRRSTACSENPGTPGGASPR